MLVVGRHAASAVGQRAQLRLDAIPMGRKRGEAMKARGGTRRMKRSASLIASARPAIWTSYFRQRPKSQKKMR